MPGQRHLLIWALLALLVCIPATGATVASIPRLAKGTWVMDRTGTLRSETIKSANEYGNLSVRSGWGQLAVVVVDSTGKVSPRTFAARLFKRWALGEKGALLLISKGDRKAEIVLGDGLDAPVDLKRRKELMKHLVPMIASGNIDGAVLEGTQQLSQLLSLKGTVQVQPDLLLAETLVKGCGTSPMLLILLMLASVFTFAFGGLNYLTRPSGRGAVYTRSSSDDDFFRTSSSRRDSSHDGGHASASSAGNSYCGDNGSSGSGGGSGGGCC
jgi:uncharacterized membrane protein YgcG